MQKIKSKEETGATKRLVGYKTTSRAKQMLQERLKGETNTLTSLTMPNLVLPLSTLIERHIRGQYVPQTEGIYDMETPTELDKMDFTERLQYLHDNTHRINELREELKIIHDENKQYTQKTVTEGNTED